ncbi:Sll0314/Alr1548 family TPR repeat-containing protein [Floridanema evergladense]|uniref:Sll0314/Alr1548 family TPR repeat-containing protein n=1 Tax=Floridaenema evergladense BLCC-F167 TaxID=3153639 RepID=A0ABV4WFQ0_9CYAN
MFSTPKKIFAVGGLSSWKGRSLIGSLTIALSLSVNLALAGDPFRATNPKPIGEKTEKAFNAVFRDGNYKAATEIYLPEAEAQEPNEPLIYAMKASMVYTDWQGDKKNQTLLDSFKSYAAKTRETAEKLKATDPLRGNLYLAVGHGLDAAAVVTEKGTLSGATEALGKLQEVYRNLDEAEKIAPEDKEFNLLKGWLDLLISVNLPFSNPELAIQRLEKAAPSYLAYRGIAVGRRDLKQYQQAQEYVDRALQETPNNPELNYLKAQILVDAKKDKEAQKYFQSALANSEQLPKEMVAQIVREQCKSQNTIDGRTEQNKRNCSAIRNQVRAMTGKWGPSLSQLPKLD